MKDIIEKAKNRFTKMIDDNGLDPYRLINHVNEVERWANYMCNKYKDADREVVLLGAWLHDLGHYPITDIDHAVEGEKRARIFLINENYDEEKKEAVLHCIRAHRCRDVLPSTLEAKIVAFIDSASHMTDSMYYNIVKDYKLGKTTTNPLDKIERDLRDLNTFPEEKGKLLGMYEAWKNLIQEYEKLDI